MKSVTTAQKNDFKTKQKYITLTFSGGTVLTNDNIVLDSMSITRTLSDSEQLSFNTVYASEFSIQIFNDGRKYDGQTVTVSLTAGTYTTDLGTYTVVSNPRSNDRLYRTLTAYDSIAAVLSKNYADWHNGLKNNAPATIGAYRTAFFNHIGITQANTTLCNDSTAFNYAEATSALSGATILGELCSINGTFGYLDFDQVFRWVTPYIDASGTLVPSLTLYPSTGLYPASVDAAIENLGVDTYKVDTDSYDLGGLACEEFVTHNITQVYMHQGDVVYASGTDGNRLTITNTLFIMEPTVAAQAVANIKATVKDFNYTPTSITMLATPWLELCDVVVAEVSSTEKVYFPVLNFVINGTGAIRQTIEAKGVMVNSDEATNTDYKIITASNSADYAAELARQAQQAANAAQESADAAAESIPGVNLSPFFSHRLDDTYNATTNPNGYWCATFNKTAGGATFEYTLLEDGWMHVHIDASEATANQRNDMIIPVASDSIAPGETYTFLMELRNNHSTGPSSTSDIYLMQYANTQFWGASVTSAPAQKLDGIGRAVNVNLITEADVTGAYCYNRSTKVSEIDNTHGDRSKLCGWTTRVTAGAVLDYDVRLSLYEGVYMGPYVPYVVSDVSAIRETADTAKEDIDNLSIGGRNLILGTLSPSAVPAERPHLAGQPTSTHGRGTCTVAEHGLRFTLTSANWCYIYFGESGNGATPSMLGLDAGETYTFSADLSWKALSSEEGLANETTYYMGAQLLYSTEETSGTSWTTAKRYDAFPITQADKGTDMSGRLEFTFTIPETAVRIYFGVKVNDNTASHYAVGDYLEARNMKLEKGNRATDWTPAPEDVEDAIDELYDELVNYIEGTELIVGTQTASTAAWTGVAGFESLDNGQQITYWLPYAGVSGVSDTLNLTLKGGGTTGAVPVYYRGATRATTHFPAGSTIRMTYMTDANVNGTSYTGWWCDASYDSGNTYNRIRFENSVKAKVLIEASRLIVGKDGLYFPLAASTPFDITMPILYAVSEIQLNATGTNNYIAINTATLRNNAPGITLTQYATCYIVGTLAGNVFTPKAAPFFTSTVPTTNDGYYYVSLGYLATAYQIYLYPEHPIYKFVDGSFKSLNQVAYEASVTASDAQDAADTAQQAADDAQTAADNAQQSADDAQTAADNAQQSADDAQATADAAETKAKQAMATYGNCSTAASTPEKAVTCDDFPFVAGATLKVYFASASDVATPTLNVNSTGAKAIYVKGQTVNATTNPLMWAARTYITFIYDGTKFNVLDTPGTYTITCQTADATHAKVTGTMYNAIIMTGTTVNVFFTTAYTTSGALTLKVDSTTARTVFFGDAAVSSTNPFTWNAGTNISFTLQGGYWYIADSGATDKATEAGRTATNYMYMSTAKGLVISRSPVTNDAGVEALSAPNSRVVSDGFDVYKNGTARVAHFGATTDIGETGNSHLTIDSTSLKFKNGNDTDNLVINNNISGNGKKTDTNVVLDEDRTYNNVDGTLNQSTMAQLLYAIVEAHTMTSAYGDYVTSTTGVALNIVIKGYATLDPTTGSDTPVRCVRIDSYGGLGTISNGVLTYVPAESSASEWTSTVTEFASLFASGCTGFWIWLDFELVYPINGVAMTVGTRAQGSTIGAGSVSIGSGNTASGNGSAAFGKDLIVTHDYGVIVGENNVPIENANTGVEEDVAFAVGAGGSTPFAILKNGIMIMSAVNSGMSQLTNFKYGKTTDVRVDFEHEYPNTPFIFMTLNEDNIPSNRVSDYSRIQIYLKSVDTTGFTATVVHGGTSDHTFNFSWLAICPM